MQLAPPNLMPLDRHLPHGHAQRLRAQEQLDVEDPRREVLVREDRARGGPAEELEPALRVPDVAHADDAEDGVQPVHEHVPQERALQHPLR